MKPKATVLKKYYKENKMILNKALQFIAEITFINFIRDAKKKEKT